MSTNGLMKFYKSLGAAQFRVIDPKFKKIQTQDGQDRWILDKEGAVLLEAAPGNGNGKNPEWDWNKKIVFAISFADICQLLETPVNPDERYSPNRLRGAYEGTGRIFHNHENTPKTLQLTPGTGKYEYTWMLTLQQGSNKAGNLQTVSVPLSDGEHNMIMRILTGLAPKLLGLD